MSGPLESRAAGQVSPGRSSTPGPIDPGLALAARDSSGPQDELTAGVPAGCSLHEYDAAVESLYPLAEMYREAFAGRIANQRAKARARRAAG